MSEQRGKLIVVEGTDASGKGTQTQRLYERLCAEKVRCEMLSFPRYETPTGNIVKRYLGKEPYEQEFGPANEVPPKIASVFYAIDRFFAAPLIRRNVQDGIHVLANRYVESNMGHQGGKIRDAAERAAFMFWLEELEYGTFQLPRPDVVLFLYMPHEVACELRAGRGGAADGHEASIEHLRNAEQAYLELAEQYRWTRVDCAPDKTLRSLRTIENIAEEVSMHVLHMLDRNERNP